MLKAEEVEHHRVDETDGQAAREPVDNALLLHHLDAAVDRLQAETKLIGQFPVRSAGVQDQQAAQSDVDLVHDPLNGGGEE
jgi:hypothetical protein